MKYTFEIIDNHVVCSYNNETIQNYKVLSLLRTLDKRGFEKIKINHNNITLIKDGVIIILKNIKLFNENNLLNNVLKNTIPQLKKEIVKLRISQIKDLAYSNIKLNGKKVAVGSLAFTLLMGNAYADQLIEETPIEPVDNKIESLDKNITINSKFETKEQTIKLENKKETKEQVISINSESFDTISLDVQNKYGGEVTQTVESQYNDIINKYAHKRGISPNIIKAMASQESGGRYTNIMNILFKNWKDFLITVYNYDENKYDKVVLTNTPSKYDSDVICINESELMNKNTNIAVGTILLSYNLKQLNYNIPASITAYNCGIGGVKRVIKAASYNAGISYDEMLNNPTNLDWLNYRYLIKQENGGAGGDPIYLENVLRYANEEEVLSAYDIENNKEHKMSVEYQKENSLAR